MEALIRVYSHEQPHLGALTRLTELRKESARK